MAPQAIFFWAEKLRMQFVVTDCHFLLLFSLFFSLFLPLFSLFLPLFFLFSSLFFILLYGSYSTVVLCSQYC